MEMIRVIIVLMIIVTAAGLPEPEPEPKPCNGNKKKGNCGRSDGPCPAGYRCDVHPTDKYAYCCEKPGSEPSCPTGQPLKVNGIQKLCGGIGGIQCPEEYTCMLDGNFTDAGGKCCEATSKTDCSFGKPYGDDDGEPKKCSKSYRCPDGYTCKKKICCPEDKPSCPKGKPLKVNGSQKVCGGKMGLTCPDGYNCMPDSDVIVDVAGKCCKATSKKDCSFGKPYSEGGSEPKKCSKSSPCPDGYKCKKKICCPKPSKKDCRVGKPYIDGGNEPRSCSKNKSCPYGYKCKKGKCCPKKVCKSDYPQLVKENVFVCGTIQGIRCDTGYDCKLQSYKISDAAGVCCPAKK